MDVSLCDRSRGRCLGDYKSQWLIQTFWGGGGGGRHEIRLNAKGTAGSFGG